MLPTPAHPRSITILIALILVFSGFIPFLAPRFSRFLPLGAVCAVSTDRQTNVASSATESTSQTGKVLNGMEALSDLAKDQPVSKEFLRTLEARRKDVEAREKAVKLQEQELLLLRQDIEAKVAHLEKIRAELEQMTQQVDKSRKKDLAKAVQTYSAMDPASVAKVFNQMDLESVVAILKQMDVETAGGILDEMAKSGTDSEKLGKLKEIGEALIDAKKAKKQ